MKTPTYSKTSALQLATADRRLQAVFSEVLNNGFDHTILEGYRDEETQNRYFAEGKSKLRFPDGKHNRNPSRAVDAVPYPILWNDPDPKVRERYFQDMARFAGFVQATALSMGITLRWGGDWDRDWSVVDNRFNDFPHFELVED